MEERWVSVPDMTRDPRWGRSSSRLADELKVGSMFSSRLILDAAPHHTMGGMNLYATASDAFSDEDQMLAILLASLARWSSTPPANSTSCGPPSSAAR